MISSFKNKGLKEIFEKGQSAKIEQKHLKKIEQILFFLDSASKLTDIQSIKSYRVHQLKKPPYIGYWSIDVSGNFRIIFKFENGKIENVGYLDTH